MLNSYTDDTPEGRMITQLKWLKERAENYDLPLPVDQDYLSTIRYVYTDGELCRHASAPNKTWEEIEVPMKNIIRLAKKGSLLYKSAYELFAIRYINALIYRLRNASRSLSKYEQGMIQELQQIKRELIEQKIMPPLGSPLPNYPNFRKVFRINKSSIDDLPDGKILCKEFNNLVFNGTRPDSWLTPALANKETQRYIV